ncbi:MAG: tRNA 2-selenouridine(34) synthase MnmH [Bacteroidales bacterium]|jgi:tRNA 2-selenouridine synthase|nr:tRNA 2-selenouridine(34) synthase MnmH [Bacteroidales bacterium]
MSQKISVEEFYNLSKNISIVDVRSPKEFETGHIPGAHSIPIFSNKEREIVGTKYKKSGKESAVLTGLEIVGSKLRSFAETSRKLSKNNKLLVHCWRGGMRSASMAWLFETVGIETLILEGGYKAFRNYGKSQLAESKKLIVVGGLTGSGKTETLLMIKEKGEQVIDLEGIAHHKGSVFGALGQEPQPTNEQFENNLIYEWLDLDNAKPIWLEDESHSIGSNWIPEELFNIMRKTTVIKMELNKSERIKRLVNEYAGFDAKYLEECILRIGKRLGGQHVKSALESLKSGQLDVVADITLAYYDKSYNFGLDQRTNNTVYPVSLKDDNPEKNAKILIEFAKKNLS